MRSSELEWIADFRLEHLLKQHSVRFTPRRLRLSAIDREASRYVPACPRYSLDIEYVVDLAQRMEEQRPFFCCLFIRDRRKHTKGKQAKYLIVCGRYRVAAAELCLGRRGSILGYVLDPATPAKLLRLLSSVNYIYFPTDKDKESAVFGLAGLKSPVSL